MKPIYSFEDYCKNEGIFGGILNFFKGLWKKAALEIQKLNDDPNRIKDYIIKNTLNPSGATNVFKPELEKFTKIDDNTKPLEIINLILNKDTGILGKQGIGMLFNDPSLKGEKMAVKRLSFEFIINTARDQVIANIKYNPAGNLIFTPTGASASTGGVTNPPQVQAKSTVGFIDKNYLASLKNESEKLLIKNNIGGAVEAIKNWINTNIELKIVEYAKAVREDDIRAAVKKGGGVYQNTDYKVGDVVRYKKKTYDENKSEEENKDNIGSSAIVTLNDKEVGFKDSKGVPFTKTKDQVFGKETGDENATTKFKVGDEVNYKKNDGTTSPKPKKIEKIEGGKYFFTDDNSKQPFSKDEKDLIAVTAADESYKKLLNFAEFLKS